MNRKYFLLLGNGVYESWHHRPIVQSPRGRHIMTLRILSNIHFACISNYRCEVIYVSQLIIVIGGYSNSAARELDRTEVTSPIGSWFQFRKSSLIEFFVDLLPFKNITASYKLLSAKQTIVNLSLRNGPIYIFFENFIRFAVRHAQDARFQLSSAATGWF